MTVPSVAVFGNLVLVLMVLSVNSQIQTDDYIVQVSASCPPFSNDTTVVKVVTDIENTIPFLVCSGGRTYNMIRQDAATFTLGVEFVGLVDYGCVFYKKQGIQTYTVNVYVPFSDGVFLFDQPPHTITCIYDPYGTKATNETVFGESPVQIKEVKEHLGEVSKSTISMYVADILGRPIQGSIPLGKTIMLVATMSGNVPGEVSFQALSCVAIGGQHEYSFLIAGCGDGQVIRKDKGFTTKGREAKSPYFRSFRLAGSNIVTYDCSFGICNGPCDGNSCAKARRRRDVSNHGYIRQTGGALVRVTREIWSPEDDSRNQSAVTRRPQKQLPESKKTKITDHDAINLKTMSSESSAFSVALQKFYHFVRAEMVQMNFFPLLFIVVLLVAMIILYHRLKIFFTELEVGMKKCEYEMPNMPLDN